MFVGVGAKEEKRNKKNKKRHESRRKDVRLWQVGTTFSHDRRRSYGRSVVEKRARFALPKRRKWKLFANRFSLVEFSSYLFVRSRRQLEITFVLDRTVTMSVSSAVGRSGPSAGPVRITVASDQRVHAARPVDRHALAASGVITSAS